MTRYAEVFFRQSRRSRSCYRAGAPADAEAQVSELSSISGKLKPCVFVSARSRRRQKTTSPAERDQNREQARPHDRGKAVPARLTRVPLSCWNGIMVSRYGDCCGCGIVGV